MKSDLTELVFVLDRSGSMASMAVEAVSGFNAFLEEQKKQAGEAKMTLVLFDHEYSLIYDGKNIQEVEPLTNKTFTPRGTTALLDALGRTIDDVGARLAATPEEERPSKVLVAILTDGQENASRDYKKIKIHELITHQTEKYSWEFLFLAANQDAFSEAASLGISLNNTSNYAATGKGLADAFTAVSCSTAAYRLTGVVKNLADAIQQATQNSDSSNKQ
jgi:uncharacterized protein YegL